jgi:hypothetical protein
MDQRLHRLDGETILNDLSTLGQRVLLACHYVPKHSDIIDIIAMFHFVPSCSYVLACFGSHAAVRAGGDRDVSAVPVKLCARVARLMGRPSQRLVGCGGYDFLFWEKGFEKT